MKRSFLLAPALMAAALFMFVSHIARADDAPATQPSVATGSVTVTVNDADGKAVVGAHVAITAPRKGGKKKAAAAAPQAAAGGGGKATPLAQGDTGADGTVTLKDIAAGDYSVAVTTDDGQRGRGKVTITAGETASVTVSVKARKPAADAPATSPAN
jgi:hypothetical protein